MSNPLKCDGRQKKPGTKPGFFIPPKQWLLGLFVRHGRPLAGISLSLELAIEFPVLYASGKNDRLVLLKICGKTQFPVLPPTISDRTDTCMLGLDGARNDVALQLED